MCTWREEVDSDMAGTWNTECQNMFSFSTDGPEENGFNYCPYCGDALHVSKPEYSEESNRD